MTSSRSFLRLLFSFLRASVSSLLAEELGVELSVLIGEISGIELLDVFLLLLTDLEVLAM